MEQVEQQCLKLPINVTPEGNSYGIKASYFKNAAIPTLDWGGVIGTITTMVTKDLLIFEVYED